ncbi:MAG: 50S ribosomal protein L11 methyltransferase [Oceanicoccus sp.]|uniref:50S ribosomal protein L11 methyltransferase n=1 Tax=Oceanicoccus sp. TaxID=2691044 RepID=UPI002613CF3E|nr:50S ribosomal protein L11 methyltransferase [Oceanicoccus sp.]MCP3908160.1 50S ribosomal protein L11 methyltransferase [Oceanicoccus sp.]
MSWLQLRVDTSRETTEAIEDALLAAGAVSVTMEDSADQPILEPAVGETPLWNQTRVTGLFNADTDTDQATVIATASFGQNLPTYRWEILEDRDWEREWMENFHPMRFGQRLWICPSWKTPPEADAVNLMLDPGLAFGTGTHPTTALCLEWLDGCDVTGKTVVDYGCGSGILGIAALLLGAKEVVAVDNDPQALIATLDNAKRNNIDSSKISVYLPDDAPNDYQADIMLANILAGPLGELSPILSKMTDSNGLLALSGIISSQSAGLLEIYQQWFDMDKPVLQDEWVRLTGKKHP